MNEFRDTSQPNSVPPTPGEEGSPRPVSIDSQGVHGATALPVSADRGGRAIGLASIAGCYRAIGDKWLEAMNKQVNDSLKGGV